MLEGRDQPLSRVPAFAEPSAARKRKGKERKRKEKEKQLEVVRCRASGWFFRLKAQPGFFDQGFFRKEAPRERDDVEKTGGAVALPGSRRSINSPVT